MKYLLILLSLVLVSACSDGDSGLRYSDNFLDQQKREKAAQTSESCAFTDINYQPVTDKYSAITETLITDLFSKYVTGLQPLDRDVLSGQVKYSEWLSNEGDKIKLCTVINHFTNTDSTQLTGDSKKVFFINAYNILTIELILKSFTLVELSDDRDEVKFPDKRSIKNIFELGDAVWDTFSWKIGNQSFTLNQIEKGTLIPMGDARVHFAVNCASRGCPPLRNEAFNVSELDEQLNEMSDFFVSSLAYHDFELFDEYDPESERNFYYLSPIFKWYANDFKNDKVNKYGSVRAFIVKHLKISEDTLGFPIADLLNENIWKEKFNGYKWSLNEVGD